MPRYSLFILRYLPFSNDSFDVITILEVLEHLGDPAKAAKEVLRVANRFVIASVPSHEDNNPEHIHLFNTATFTKLFLDAGAQKVQVDYFLGHMIGVIQ